MKVELLRRHAYTNLGEMRCYLDLQITRDRAASTIVLTQSQMVQHILQCFGLQFSSTEPNPPSACHALSSLVLDEPFKPSGQYAEVVGCLILGEGAVSLRSNHSSPVAQSICEADVYGGSIADQELCWLTFLLTDLGESPSSAPVLFADNTAMILLCHEPRLEGTTKHVQTKHIALRYFLARELQQRGQLRLVYVATRANTADIFTEALPPGDHQRFSTILGLVPTLRHLLTA
ncbi:unnamed protein product [Closterium sp. NIES-53]